MTRSDILRHDMVPFDRRIEHRRIKKYGERSKIRTAIREEPIKMAQYLRGEKGRYEPLELFE